MSNQRLTKRQEVFYSIALALILAGALIIEVYPLWAIGMIAGAGLCVRIAERR